MSELTASQSKDRGVQTLFSPFMADPESYMSLDKCKGIRFNSPVATY